MASEVAESRERTGTDGAPAAISRVGRRSGGRRRGEPALSRERRAPSLAMRVARASVPRRVPRRDRHRTTSTGGRPAYRAGQGDAGPPRSTGTAPLSRHAPSGGRRDGDRREGSPPRGVRSRPHRGPLPGDPCARPAGSTNANRPPILERPFGRDGDDAVPESPAGGRTRACSTWTASAGGVGNLATFPSDHAGSAHRRLRDMVSGRGEGSTPPAGGPRGVDGLRPSGSRPFGGLADLRASGQ